MPNPADGFALHQAAFDPMQSVNDGYDYANLSKLRGALDQGADVNATNERGQTALHVTQSPHAAKMLLEAGANPTALDHDGLLPSQARNVSTGAITHKANGVDRIVEAAAKEQQGQQVEQKSPEVSLLEQAQQARAPSLGAATQDHQAQSSQSNEQLFNNFKGQVTGQGDRQAEQTPLQQAQQARSSSLGGAVKTPGREAGEPDVSALKGARLSDMPRDTQQAPDVSAHKGARLMDLKIPERGGQERSAGDDFNRETTRRAAAHMPPTLGQATVEKGMAPAAKEQEAEQGQGKGQGEGGRSKPSHESYYQAVSSGSIATPERDVQSAQKQQARRAVDRSRSMGF